MWYTKNTGMVVFHNYKYKCIRMLGEVFWVVKPCGFIGGYQRFGLSYRLHLQYFTLNMEDSTFLWNLGNHIHKTTQRHSPEDHNRHLHRTENIRSQRVFTYVYVQMYKRNLDSPSNRDTSLWCWQEVGEKFDICENLGLIVTKMHP
jgi:hypothetical protein